MISITGGEFVHNGGNQANWGHVAWNNHTLAGMAATTARQTGYQDVASLMDSTQGLASDRTKIRHSRPAPYCRFGWRLCEKHPIVTGADNPFPRSFAGAARPRRPSRTFNPPRHRRRLFSASDVLKRGRKSHDSRDHTICLVCFGLGMMQGGYRRLLFHPYRRRS
jgi:hypothetical protein